jgi:hypothetical protein
MIKKWFQFITESTDTNPFMNSDYYKGDYIQAIYNVFYKYMNDNSNRTNYDSIKYLKDSYGEEFALIVLLALYNSQVCNGGHSQYFHNGYASQHTEGFFKDHKDLGLLEEMNFLLEKYLSSDLSKKVLTITQKAKNILEDIISYDDEECYDCGGDGEIESYDDEYETCSTCHGEGKVDESEYLFDQLSKLDDNYYEIDDRFIEELNTYAQDRIDSYESEFAIKKFEM